MTLGAVDYDPSIKSQQGGKGPCTLQDVGWWGVGPCTLQRIEMSVSWFFFTCPAKREVNLKKTGNLKKWSTY